MEMSAVSRVLPSESEFGETTNFGNCKSTTIHNRVNTSMIKRIIDKNNKLLSVGVSRSYLSRD